MLIFAFKQYSLGVFYLSRVRLLKIWKSDKNVKFDKNLKVPSDGKGFWEFKSWWESKELWSWLSTIDNKWWNL
jgi:hypothetical protein